MRDESKCPKIYRNVTIMGRTIKAHVFDIKICQNCKYFTPKGCNVYHRNEAEQSAKRILKGRYTENK